MKKWWKTIAFKDKLDVIGQLQKSERIANIRRDIMLAHSSVCTIHDNVDSIWWTARLGTKVGTARICYSRSHSIFSCTLINVRAPTNEKPDEIKEEFYNLLEQNLNQIANSDIKIILRDFNAKIGKENIQTHHW